VQRARGTRWQKRAKKVAHSGALTICNTEIYVLEKVASFCVKNCPKNVPQEAKSDNKLIC
jgi:hypothetical protein